MKVALTPVLNNNRNNNSPNFGMLYSSNTIKSLKRVVPDIVKQEGFESARLAIANLKTLGHRKDNIVLHIDSEDLMGIRYIEEPAVNKVKNKTFSGFIYCYLDSPTCINSETPFFDFTKTLMTDNFVKLSHSRINKYENFLRSESFKDKLVRKTSKIKENFEDGIDFLLDKLSFIDNPPRLDGKKTMPTLVAWDDLKRYINSIYDNAKASKNKEIAFLRKEIDTLPTKLS